MGCSSTKASAKSSSAEAPTSTEAPQPEKVVETPVVDEEVPAPPPDDFVDGRVLDELEVDEVAFENVNEGLRDAGRLAAIVPVGRASRGVGYSRSADNTGTGPSAVVLALGAMPPIPAEATGSDAMVTQLSLETEEWDITPCTRNSGRLRTAALGKTQEQKFSYSPFNSVPHETLAETSLFWNDHPATEFNVRAAGYSTHGQKEPSKTSLYSCVGADVLKGANVGELLRHKRCSDFKWWKDANSDWDVAWGVPRLLVVNMMMPIHSPMGFTKKPPGATLVAYFQLTAAACADLESGQPCPQMRLWQRIVKEGKSTRGATSFKAIGQLPERSLAELPKMLHSYNGKPVLVTDSATFVKDLLPEILEVDVDVGKWAFLARQTLYSYQGLLAKHAFHVGYLVEGRTEEELPERMLGCFCISGADLAAAAELDG